MNNFLFPIYAVIVGVIIAYLTKDKTVINTKLLLAFSGSFLLALTLFELLPEVYHHIEAKRAGFYIMCGIMLQIVLELFSKGAEHGHVHVHKNSNHFPWLLFISLCIHSCLEGFPIHQHNTMVYGVLIHKIPIATLISVFLFQSKHSTLQIALFLLVFALMTPLGTFISNMTNLSENALNSINALVIGIFFHIATTILFETGEGHKFNLSKFITIILGIATAYII